MDYKRTESRGRKKEREANLREKDRLLSTSHRMYSLSIIVKHHLERMK